MGNVAGTSLRNSNPSSNLSRGMLEAEAAMEKLHKTINNFQKNPGALTSQTSQVRIKVYGQIISLTKSKQEEGLTHYKSCMDEKQLENFLFLSILPLNFLYRIYTGYLYTG